MKYALDSDINNVSISFLFRCKQTVTVIPLIIHYTSHIQLAGATVSLKSVYINYHELKMFFILCN